ncbi:MAG TPA: hypothetical protein PKA55_17965 [Rhodoblastus sp.]|nr:hypothetical protein [Rhodoblastus sp.]
MDREPSGSLQPQEYWGASGMTRSAKHIAGIVIALALLAVWLLGCNALAQKIYPTRTTDWADRRFSYGLLVKFFYPAPFLLIAASMSSK